MYISTPYMYMYSTKRLCTEKSPFQASFEMAIVKGRLKMKQKLCIIFNQIKPILIGIDQLINKYVYKIAHRLEPRSGPTNVGPDLGPFASSTILF